MSPVIRIESFPEENGPQIAGVITRYTGMYGVDELLAKLPVEIDVEPEGYEDLKRLLDQLGCNASGSLEARARATIRGEISSFHLPTTIPWGVSGSLFWVLVLTSLVLTFGGGLIVIQTDLPLVGAIYFIAFIMGCILGARAWRYRPRTVAIENSLVRVSETVPFVSDWQEPLARFSYVRLRAKFELGGEHGGGGRYYLIELVHATDSSKIVVLFHHTEEAEARKVWRDAAKTFNLPATYGG